MRPSAVCPLSWAFAVLLWLAWLGPLGTANAGVAGDGAVSDGEYRRLVVGTWEDDYQGHRIMTIRSDGSATMVVQLHGWKAALYASELRFDMVWSIDQGHLKKQTTGGEPSGRVKAILKMMGDRVNEKILELTSERLLLLDQDGKRQYDWRRSKPKP